MERWAPREGELLTKRKGKMVENNDGEQRKERKTDRQKDRQTDRQSTVVPCLQTTKEFQGGALCITWLSCPSNTCEPLIKTVVSIPGLGGLQCPRALLCLIMV